LVLKTFLVGVLVALVQLFLGLVFSVSAISAGLTLLDRLTKEADEWKLIKKGNVAVGVLYGMVTLSLIIMIEPSVLATVTSVSGAIMAGAWLAFVLQLLTLVIALLLSVLMIYTTLRVVDGLTADVSEFGEIIKGNVAMAILTGSMVLAVSLVLRSGILYIVTALTGAI